MDLSSRLRAWLRPDPVAGLALYGLAFWIRSLGAAGAIYGDEGFHYFISRHWGGPMETVLRFTGAEKIDASALFWWRPAFMVTLTPAALVSFEAYRYLFIGYTSTLAVLVMLVLRDRGTVRPIAYGAGLLVAVHPYFMVWGVRVFPDMLMTTAFVAALWAAGRGWAWASGALVLLAVWIKESAIVGAAALGLIALVDALRTRQIGIRPWRATKPVLAYAAAGLLALLPLAYALHLGLTFPGWGRGGDPRVVVDRLFLTLWLAPLVLLGLVWPRSRRPALLALVYPAFYLHYRLVLGRAVEIWYYALPSVLVILGAALALDESMRHTKRLERFCMDCIPKSVGVTVALLFAFYVVAPNTNTAKELTMPYSHSIDLSLVQTVDQEQHRDQDLPQMMAKLRPEQWRESFVIDVGWFFVLHPFGTQGTVRWAYTYALTEKPDELGPWVDLIENRTTVTVVAKYDHPLNLSIRAAYADCVQYENAGYSVIDGPSCPGHAGRLRDAFASRWKPSESAL